MTGRSCHKMQLEKRLSNSIWAACLSRLYFYLLAVKLGMRKWKAFSFKPFFLSKLTDLDIPKTGGGLGFHQL